MAYSKPAVVVYQQYTRGTVEPDDPARACILGPVADLHRFSEPTEKDGINLGPYNRAIDSAYSWPSRSAGGIVDEDSVKLFIENALLLYFEDLIGVTTGGRGTVTPVSGRNNWVKSSTINFITNGDSVRDNLLYDRDVQIGDAVYIRGVSDVEDECDEHELWTYVDGFVANEEAGTVGAASADANNQDSLEAAESIEQIAGAENCVIAAADGSGYAGLADGYPEEIYTITVIKSSVAGCQAARLRITSDSGTDDVAEVTPSEFGVPTEIGTRGLEVTFSIDTGACETESETAGIVADEFIVGQQWQVSVSQQFEAVCALSGGSYDGPDDDIYIIEVTKGGLWADLPEITVTTTNGLDSSGPHVVTGDYVEVEIGSHNVTVQFVDCFGSNADSASASSEPLGGDLNVSGLNKGDKFYITVTTGQNGPVRTLILRHDLPDELLDATDLDLRLFMQETIEVSQDKLSDPPNQNYDIESTQIIVNAGITAYHADWTDDGVQQPLLVWDGRTDEQTGAAFGVLHAEYREWLQDLTNTFTFIETTADIDTIPGPLDRLNPGKWGVHRALLNSKGTKVGFVGVSSPDSLDNWQIPLERVQGREDIYNLVAMTYDREVHSLLQSLVNADSAPETGAWKAMFAPIKADPTKMIVGKSATTSLNGATVLAVLEDNPAATGTQYTRLRVPAGNSGFVSHGVKAGDVVRFLYTIDAFGEAAYTEFTVDTVLSENSLLLLSGHTAPISVAQKVEIWRNLSPSELIDELKGQAASYADFRVCAVYPNQVGTAGEYDEGYFAAAASAGMVSGLAPHQPATNVPYVGYDDATTYTTGLFSESQLNDLASAGVWIITEDKVGQVIPRHALTTGDIDDSKKANESFRRNLDLMSGGFRDLLRPYVGNSNATDTLLRLFEFLIQNRLRSLKTTVITPELGPRLIAGDFALDDEGNILLRRHPIAADQTQIGLDLTLPQPNNKTELFLNV